MTLRIIMDEVASQDWGARQFKKKLINECNHQSVAYEVSSDWITDTSYIPEYNENTSYNNQIVLEPNGWQDDEDYAHNKVLCCLDRHTTANVVFDTIKAYMSVVGDVKVCMIGYGKLVGRPLKHMLDCSKIECYVVRSNTENVQELIDNSDVVVTAIPFGEKLDYDFTNKYVIDVGNNVVNPTVNYKVIGDGTTRTLIQKYIDMHM